MDKEKLARNNPHMRMVVNILKYGNIIDHKVSEVLKKFGITHIQFNILRLLEAVSPESLSVGEITKGLLFPTSDVSRILDRLVKKDLITRSICEENRRRMDIHISSKGFEVLEAALPKIDAALNGFYKDRVSKEESETVIGILKKLEDKFI